MISGTADGELLPRGGRRSCPAGTKKIWRRFAPDRYIAIDEAGGQQRPDRVAGEQQARHRRRARRSATAGTRRSPRPARRRTRARAAARTRGTTTRIGMSTAIAAPSAAPDAVPSTYGSASGLRSRPWNVAPATASPSPTTIAASTRGSRRSITIVSVGRGQVGRRASRPRRRCARIAIVSPRRHDDRSRRQRQRRARRAARRRPARGEDQRVDGPIDRVPAPGGARRPWPGVTGRSTSGATGSRAGRRGPTMPGRRRCARSGWIAGARCAGPATRRGPGRVIDGVVDRPDLAVLDGRHPVPAGRACRPRPASRRTRRRPAR